jgi:acetyl-CoA synthetase
MTATDAFRAARDQLIDLREDHERAVAEFAFPDVGERFNWAIDWFDAIARGNNAKALVIVEEDGSSREVSFDAMAARSDRVAAWLSDRGLRKGDPVIVMLGNQVELWDLMLGIMKLGAVIMPTTTAAGTSDLQDRVDRGGAKLVVTTPEETWKFDGVTGDFGRFSVGPRRAGRISTRHTRSMCRPPPTRERHRATPCSTTSPPAPRADPSSSSTPR